MSYIHILFTTTIRRSRHALYLFFLTFVCAILGTTGVYFRHIITEYNDSILADTGYTLSLSHDDGTVIPATILQQLEALPAVDGLNMMNSALLQPVNFHNSVPQNTTDVFSTQEASEIRLLGNYDITKNLTFKQHCQFVSGHIPDASQSGVLIDDWLARQNSLSIGDAITLSDSEKQYTFTVQGIYTTTSSIIEEQDTGEYTEYAVTPYSYIFCDLDSYNQIQSVALDKDSVSLYGKDFASLSIITEEIRSMGLLDAGYSLFNVTAYETNFSTVAFRSMKTMASLMSAISISVAGLILFLVILLWLRTNYHDIAILLTLGQSRVAIIWQYFLSTTFVVGAALLVAAPLCMLQAYWFDPALAQTAFSITGAASGNGAIAEIDSHMVAALQTSLSLGDCLRANLVYLIISWAGVLLASVEIIKCRPRILFHLK